MFIQAAFGIYLAILAVIAWEDLRVKKEFTLKA